CIPSSLVAMAVLRVLVNKIRSVNSGVNFVIRLTLTLAIDIPQLDRILTYLTESLCPSIIPHPPESIDAWMQGQIDDDTFVCWLGAHGVSRNVWGPVITARSEHLHARETIEWGRRNRYEPGAIDELLKHRGWRRDEDRARVQELYDELPTIGDHLHWMARNVFDEEYVKDYQLMKGFEERFWVKFGPDLRA